MAAVEGVGGASEGVGRATAPDRRIRAEGTTSEAEWLDWLAALNPTALSIDTLLAGAERLVVVSPHPDDEVLACGGLIAMQARRGARTVIVAVTDGDASHRGDPEWPPERLAVTRQLERRRGLEQLGISVEALIPLALPDGQVAAQFEALIRGLQQTLQPGDCVVSTWRLDGHPDHDAVGAATSRVCAEVGCRLIESPVWMWHWAEPDDPRVPWHRLRALQLPGNARSRKTAALAQHVTQLAPRLREAPVLGPAIMARAERHLEYFFV